MASILLNVTDLSLLDKIKQACSMLKGVGQVSVISSNTSLIDITQTAGYKEAMQDIRDGRVYEAKDEEDMVKQKNVF